MKVLVPSAARMLVLCAIFVAPAKVAAKERPAEAKSRDSAFYLSSEANLSFLGQLVSGEAGVGSVAYRLAGGIRMRGFDLFALAEHSFWRDETQGKLAVQTMQLGVGFGFTYLHRRIRTELSAGPSILLTRSQLDGPGTTGFFFDARPIGYRFRIGKRGSAVLYPLTFAFVAPVVDGIPLVFVAYRTGIVFGMEL